MAFILSLISASHLTLLKELKIKKKLMITILNRCECFDLHKELVPYKEAWSWQKKLVSRKHSLVERNQDQSDMLIVLQHPPVYTLGTGSLEKYLNFDMQNAPYDLYRTERGGEVTYHGPGQVLCEYHTNSRLHCILLICCIIAYAV